MNKVKAKKIAQTITKDQIIEMLKLAKENITDWRQQSVVNKSATKAVAWNLLTHDINEPGEINNIVKVNLIREFGEYLPNNLILSDPKRKKEVNNLVYAEPILDIF